MARQRITPYTMLTPEHRLQLLKEILARRDALIAADLPPDSPQPEKEEVVEPDQ